MQASNAHHFVIQGGKIQRATTEEHVKWCIRSLLSMQKGELISDPDIGADLMALMFRRDSPKLREEIKNHIRQALEVWEPRVDLEDVEIYPDDAEPSLLSVRIKYRIKETRRVEMVKVLV